jgi:hypothetical protein
MFELSIFFFSFLGALAAHPVAKYLLHEVEVRTSFPADEITLPFQDPMTGEFKELSIDEWEKKQQALNLQQSRPTQEESFEEILTDLQNYVRIKPNGARK